MLWDYWLHSNSKNSSSSLLLLLLSLNFFLIFAIRVETQTVTLVNSKQQSTFPTTSINQLQVQANWENDFDAPQGLSYKAAVVEYAADEDTDNLTPAQILLQNTKNYENIIADAANLKTDIIVFPEYGLTTLRFSFFGKDESKRLREQIHPFLQYIPEVGQNPCDASNGLTILNGTRSEVIERLSCASRVHKIYTLINLGEISPCTITNSSECPPTGVYHFNTAVVFDRDGQIVAKYRKINLFAEPQFDVPENPELSTFSTDFGVEFGVFICFDLLFQFPAKQLVSNEIKHFLFPTAWIDELPYLTAIQAQMFWASSSSATVLASGYHQPQTGKLGSGIFSPSGQALNYTFDPNSGTQVIYAHVPISSPFSPLSELTTMKRVERSIDKISEKQIKKISSQSFALPNEYHFYYRENLNNYTGRVIPLINEGEDNTVEVCDGDFCCELNYSLSSSASTESSMSKDCPHNEVKDNSSSLNYKLIVFNQIRKFSSPSIIKTMHLQICSIVRCLNETLQSCAESSKGSQEVLPGFQYFSLKANPFDLLDDKIAQPTFTTLDTELQLIPVELFNLTYSHDKRNLTLSSELINTFPVQTVALFNRVY